MSVRVLVPVDGSTLSEKALRYGATIAGSETAVLRLVHVHVPHPPIEFLGSTQYQYQGVDMDEYDRHDREKEELYLVELAQTMTARMDAEVPWSLIEGDVSEAIHDHAASHEADLIVLSTHGRSGVSRLWLGSRAEALVRHTDRPVLLVPARDHEPEAESAPIGRVLVALDGGELGETILPRALNLARATGAAVTLAHVIPLGVRVGSRSTPFASGHFEEKTKAAEEYLGHLAEALRSDGLKVDVKVVEGASVAAAILDLAEEVEADVIALATHSYRRLNRAVLGSVADKIIRGSSVPVLVQHPPKEA